MYRYASDICTYYPDGLPGIADGKHVIRYSVNPSNQEFMSSSHDRVHALVDEGVSGAPITAELLTHCGEMTTLPGGEIVKSLRHVDVLVEALSRSGFRNVVVVGGGAVINVCNYAVVKFLKRECIERSEFNLVIVPTNTMSIADVAYGSLGLINDERSGLKNVFREVIDPNAIFLFEPFLRYGSPSMQREGLVEAFKHCLLQDRNAVHHVLMTLTSMQGTSADLLDCAAWGLKLKADVTKAEFGASSETNIGLARNYGHLHATAIEEMYDFQVAHSDCVLIGLLTDLALVRMSDLAREIVSFFERDLLRRLLRILNGLEEDTLRQIYRTARKFRTSDDIYKVIDVAAVGEYDLTRNDRPEIRLRTVQWSEIWARLKDVIGLLAREYEIR